MITHIAVGGLLSLLSSVSALRQSDGCGKPLPGNIQAGQSLDYSIQVADPVLGNVMRTYRVHVPAPYNLNNEVPVPLVMDYHGYGSGAQWHEQDSRFIEVADQFDEEGFLVVSPNGMDDSEWRYTSFNCSRTDGPMGPPCDTDREKYGVNVCYDSCPNCDPYHSCDWTSCHDDVAFTRTLLEAIESEYCVNLDSVHISGYSNGGMFAYFAISQLSGIFASMAPVSASPLLGFGSLPEAPLSLIDFHGLKDDTIPHDLSQADGYGPHDSLKNWDGHYFHFKEDVMSMWAEGESCSPNSEPWPTPMDGVDAWQCNIWTGCKGGAELVSCTGDHGHYYPFEKQGQVEGTKILWQFMKAHPRQ